MEMEYSFEEINDFDDTEELMEDMISDSHVARIIDEMEFAENELDDLDYFDGSGIQFDMKDMY
ncbi:hypothetical protein SAMN05421690_103513 [Nitrosomonas sp. Nm51]|uniref:hypothetical protein n=1 Tax=Nitrosomonas sp. Nm51 TaxID=133720 RepID=UPI0008B2F164|nr:hypothetical protein [Nitrosomonas sp. Nm51]SER53119.1 hypothetical protein SAMN05421690_103513 [Nitrosomonas sp. Nm51]